MSIKIMDNDKWIPANPGQVLAFTKYKSKLQYSKESPVTTKGFTVYRKKNDSNLGTYVFDGKTNKPIADFNDVKVFLPNLTPADWHNPRDYIVWAYLDFMYDNKERKVYASKSYPPNTHKSDVTEIDIDGLPPNIIFSVSRNENNSVFYEWNDSSGIRIRICDDEKSRIVISNPKSSSS
jgi:hypothetical protein